MHCLPEGLVDARRNCHLQQQDVIFAANRRPLTSWALKANLAFHVWNKGLSNSDIRGPSIFPVPRTISLLGLELSLVTSSTLICQTSLVCV